MVDNVPTPATPVATPNPGAGRPLPHSAGAGRTHNVTAGRSHSAAATAPRPDRPPETGGVPGRAVAAPPEDDVEAGRRPLFAGFLLSPLTRFAAVFSVGVASTLGWQAYSDAGREAAARWCQSIAPRMTPAPLVDSAPASEPLKVPAAPAHEVAAPPQNGATVADNPDAFKSTSEVLKSTSQALAGVRDSMDRLTAEMAKLQTDHGAADRAASAAMASGQPPASKPPSRPQGH